MARDVASFRKAGGQQIYTDAASSYLLLLDPPLDEPPPLLPRALSVYSIADPDAAVTYVGRHGIALEALAVAQPEGGIRTLAARLGASRITVFGSLQAPPLAAFHGGRPRIAEFVRWVCDET
jgi:hypothetical protein